LIAVDIGNTRMKFGWFCLADFASFGGELAPPRAELELPTTAWSPEQMQAWLELLAAAPRAPDQTEAAAEPRSWQQIPWRIGSVHRAAAGKLLGWLRSELPRAPARLLTHADFPIKLAVQFPEKLGIDRIAAAVAANRLRAPDQAAIVVDLGSALTVDLISADGTFRGGAILPGIGLSARALHEFTDQLPLIPLSELAEPVPPLGDSTVAALRAGLYWGAVGAMRELIARLGAGLYPAPHILLTGGAAPAVAGLLGPEVRYVEHLVLRGIALANGSRG
jgi:type III pantothenate kinase